MTLIKISISQFIIEDNLDKLAGYYKLSYDLFNASDNLWEDFLNKEDIHNWIMRANRYWLKNNGEANNLSQTTYYQMHKMLNE
nr:hypothetical protein [Mycoplasmopsis bovis]